MKTFRDKYRGNLFLAFLLFAVGVWCSFANQIPSILVKIDGNIESLSSMGSGRTRVQLKDDSRIFYTVRGYRTKDMKKSLQAGDDVTVLADEEDRKKSKIMIIGLKKDHRDIVTKEKMLGYLLLGRYVGYGMVTLPPVYAVVTLILYSRGKRKQEEAEPFHRGDA